MRLPTEVRAAVRALREVVILLEFNDLLVTACTLHFWSWSSSLAVFSDIFKVHSFLISRRLSVVDRRVVKHWKLILDHLVDLFLLGSRDLHRRD